MHGLAAASTGFGTLQARPQRSDFIEQIVCRRRVGQIDF